MVTKQQNIRETSKEISDLLSGLFKEEKSDWDAIKTALYKTEKVKQACNNISNSNIDTLLHNICVADKSINFNLEKQQTQEFISELSNLENKFAIKMQCEKNNEDYLVAVKQHLELFQKNIDKLRDIVSFNQIESELIDAKLANVCNSYQNGNVNADNLIESYNCNLYYGLTLITINTDDRLKDFHGKAYDELIVQYTNAIDKYQKLTIQELVARLSAKVPVTGIISASSSETGILKHAIKSNGRMLSLRKLFDQIPNLLRKLCPCMLMSPISVAQYIDPSFPKFDLVIFDEASQLPTSEAVGTIARGENVIIVGDPKQLPPTNFFSSNRIDEENSDKEDLESLLDDCLAISMPQKHLKWHYRSRHESLIAYSNMKYYDNKLYTFPSPNDLVSEVKIMHLNGYYDKGKTKQNIAEARAIVSEIIRRLGDEILRNYSIGVVTFSSVQQNLIDDMLCEEFLRHPDLAEFNNKSNEPVFIKNLENVQGDERDIILFSVGYGPDKNGNVSMNFGPLNRDGGWRRLNVAISRARKSMVVYSVLKSEQIDLSRTRSEGVAGLKGFLEFAERGKTVVAKRADLNGKSIDTFIVEIADSIANMGYQVKCNIGCSEFKIDIGIIDPNNTETYLLGILLDGKNCKDSSNAHDRFVLQPSVLKGLGWSVVRIWTLDWLDNSQRVLQNIKSIIESIPERTEPKVVNNKPQTFANCEFEKEIVTPENFATAYTSAEIEPQGTSENFYLPQYRQQIQNIVAKIISVEAPISRKLLMKKVLNVWSISRVGSRVESVFMNAIKDVPMQTTIDDGRIFIWSSDQNPNLYSGYRLVDQNGFKRSMDDIPAEEIDNAMIEVLHEQISVSETDLVREIAKKFGFARIGGVIDTTIRCAIDKSQSRGYITHTDNNKITLVE